jgi:hypothetical protein
MLRLLMLRVVMLSVVMLIVVMVKVAVPDLDVQQTSLRKFLGFQLNLKCYFRFRNELITHSRLFLVRRRV